MKNYRPITLLSSIYKILAKVMANRLEPVLQHWVHPDQTAFMSGRRMDDNIRTALDVMEIAKQKKWVGAILWYDVVDWDWIDKWLEAVESTCTAPLALAACCKHCTMSL